MSPYQSADLTEIVEPEGDMFVVFRSPDTAEHKPGYVAVGRFPTEDEARAFVGSGSSAETR